MYSPRKRNSLYRAALLLLQSGDEHRTLCWAMMKVTGKNDLNIIEDFPELITRKPANRSAKVGLWWGKTKEGQAERVRVLTEAIKETSI